MRQKVLDQLKVLFEMFGVGYMLKFNDVVKIFVISGLEEINIQYWVVCVKLIFIISIKIQLIIYL